MTFNNFWEFLTLYEVRNYSEAAYQLYISESALSRHIKAMEEELDAELFIRSPREVVPTAYAEALVPYAKKILDIRNQYTAKFRALDEQSKNIITVQSNYHVNPMLAAFNERYPDIKIVKNTNTVYDRSKHLYTANAPVVALKDGMCMIAFCFDRGGNILKDSHIVALPFEKDHYCVMLSSNHPFASRTSINLSELAREDLICMERYSTAAYECVDLCREAGFEPHIVCYAEDINVMSSLVRHNGFAIVLKDAALRDNFKDVALVDLAPEKSFDIYLCYMKNTDLPESAEKLIDFALNEWPKIKGDFSVDQ